MSERVMAAYIDWTGLNEEKSIATIIKGMIYFERDGICWGYAAMQYEL